MKPESEEDRDFRLVRSIIFSMRIAKEKPSRRRIVAAIKFYYGHGLRTQEVCNHMKRFFDHEAESEQSGTAFEHAGNREQFGNNLGNAGNQPGTAFEHAGNQPGNFGNNLGTIWEDTRGTISNSKHKQEHLSPAQAPGGGRSVEAQTTKRVRITKPPIAVVSFEPEDEHRTQTMLAAIAAANASGLISSDRVLRLRAEMRAKLDEVGPERWRYGMDQANDKPAARPWDYAKGVIRNHIEPPKPKPKLAPWEAAAQDKQDAMERFAAREYAAAGIVYANGATQNGKAHG